MELPSDGFKNTSSIKSTTGLVSGVISIAGNSWIYLRSELEQAM
jgi:hypothetical protein